MSLGVSAQLPATGGRQISDAMDSPDFLTTIADPDAPAATRYDEYNFDGDETFVALHSGMIGAYNEELLESDFAGTTSIEYSDSVSRLRLSPRLVWQSRRGSGNSALLILQQLEEVRKTAAAAPVTGNTPEHVGVLELRVTDRRGIQTFGSRSPAGSVPLTGTSVFVGEMFGNFRDANGQLDEFVGDAVINVDFARGTVTAQIMVSQYLFRPLTTTPLQMTFNATISGESFVAQQVTVTGPQVFQGGTLRGAFFGPAADEIGLVLSTSGASGNIMAGLVAGKE